MFKLLSETAFCLKAEAQILPSDLQWIKSDSENSLEKKNCQRDGIQASKENNALGAT